MNNVYMPTKHRLKSITQESDIEWRFEIEYDGDATPGQFMEVSFPKVGEAPISIARINKEEKTIEMLIRKVGVVTDYLFNKKAGDFINLRGPYGNGFDLESLRDENVIIISGGSGLAPVRPLVRELYESPKFRLLMGFKDENGILFKDEVETWQSANDNVKMTLDCDNQICLVGFVTDHLDTMLDGLDPATTKVIVVGPPLMMKFATLGLVERGVREENITVSFERNMSCAVGKCGHCKIDETYVCLEGPVFNYTKAKTLLD